VNTKKIAITIPNSLVLQVDAISKQQGLSRSRFISDVLRERIEDERNQRIKEAYDRVFSDQDIYNEQLNNTAGSGASKKAEE
jgi:metal-responsive CopG/Arc/MetJ family transcriptional regulator